MIADPTSVEVVMEGRIIHLEYDVSYLRSELERVKSDIRQLRDQSGRAGSRPDNWSRSPLGHAMGALLFACFVITAILFVAMWKGFGWI